MSDRGVQHWQQYQQWEEAETALRALEEQEEAILWHIQASLADLQNVRAKKDELTRRIQA